MGKVAVAQAFEDVRAALAVLRAEVDGCGVVPFSVGDPLAGLADGCLEVWLFAVRWRPGLRG